jgi:cell division protein FtsW
MPFIMTSQLFITLALSTTAFMAALRLPLIWLERWPKLWLRLACLFAVLPLTPLGIQYNGARRWLPLPGHIAGPSHYLVLTFFILSASVLCTAPASSKAHKAEVVILIGLTLAALLAQPHFWAACVFVALVTAALALQGHAKLALAAAAIPSAALIGSLLANPYQLERMFAFLDTAGDPLGRGYQLIQNLSVIAQAQVFGPSGALPSSLARVHIYSELALIAGSLGLAAASLVMVVLASIVALGLWRSARQPQPLLRQLGLLSGLWLGLWFFKALASPLGLVPTSMVALPFLGSHFASIFGAFALGLIYRAGQSTVMPETPLLAPSRLVRILVGVVLAGATLQLGTLWTLQPPLTSTLQLRGQIFDAQGVALTELQRSGQRYSLHYRYGQSLAQVLGLINVDGQGIEGLQLHYEHVLAGTGGKPGHNLRLSIDLRQQLALEAALQPYLERYGGGIEALVMKPDGFILAAASLPSYDPNQRRELSLLMRFRPATDSAQAGSMILPFFLAHGIETQGTQFLADAAVATKIASKLEAKDLHLALVRFGFQQSTGLDFPGTVVGRSYAEVFSATAAPLSPAREKEFRRTLSEGWGVTPSLIRYGESFTAVVTGSLPQARLVADPIDAWALPRSVIKPETAALMRGVMTTKTGLVGYENLGGIWATYQPKVVARPYRVQTLRFACAALFAPADQPQRLVFIKLTSHKPLPKDLGLEIGAKVMDTVK